MILDFIEVLERRYTDEEINEMNPHQAYDNYCDILADDEAESRRDPEPKHWDDVATYNERFSGDDY